MTIATRLRFFCVIAFLLFVLASSHTSFAQINGLNNGTVTPIPGAGHDYIRLLNETVNPANGSVNVSIEAPMPKGRGLTLPCLPA